MIKVIPLLFFILLSGSNILAQNNETKKNGTSLLENSIKYITLANKSKVPKEIAAYIDTAEVYYNENPEDSILFKILSAKISLNFRKKDYDLAIEICKTAIPLVADRSDSRLINAKINMSLGRAFYKKESWDSSFVYYDKAYNLYNELIINSSDTVVNYYKGAGLSSYKKGRIQYAKNKFDEAISELFIGLRNFEVIDFKKGILQILNNIGNVYYSNGDYNNAYQEYLKTVEVWKVLYPKKEPYTLFVNIGSILLKNEQFDSALVYYRKAINGKKASERNGLKAAGIYMNIGLIFKNKYSYDSAFVYFDYANKIYKKLDYIAGNVRTKANMAICYIEMNQINKAENLFLEVLPLSIELNQAETTEEIYNGLYVIQSKKKSYKKALIYYQYYVNYKDSIHSIEVTNKINEYKEQFETEKKDKDIQNLKQLSERQKIEKEKQVTINNKQKVISVLFGVIAVSLIIILVGLRRVYRMKRVSAEEEYKKTEEENRNKVLDLVKRQEVNSINSYMEGQEKERARIASELHDKLGSLLSTVKLHFSSFEVDMTTSAESKESFSFALDLLDNSIQEVRTISRNLSKGVLTQFGLSGAIENLRDAINSAGKIQVRYIKIGDTGDVLLGSEIELFRIVQELVTNSIKHSQSDEIFIQQVNDKSSIIITVEDHGVGFDMSNIKSDGIGLDNLRMRANNIGAEYNYESAPGQGTFVTIEINA